MSVLVPRPQSQQAGQGTFRIDPRTRVLTPEAFAVPALRLHEALTRASGLVLPLHVGAAEPDDDGSAIRFERDASLGAEGYVLDVSTDRVSISASTTRGAHWAVQSFLQLLPAAVYRSARAGEAVWDAPVIRISDSPRFAWRGAMLDVARHFTPVREVRRLIDLLAMHRMNTLHLHLTDDQGWRIQIRRYPLLTEVGASRPETQVGAVPGSPTDGRPHGGFYTQDDIREIVAYAADRGIDVVPEIELPGHVQAAIAAYPELGVTTESLQPWSGWGIDRNILNVEESTVQLFRNVFDEVVELFPSAFIGVGGDECPKDQWRGDARVQERMRELGVADEEGLQSWFIGQMDEHLTARGRRLLGWDEILEGGLADGATVLSWRGRVGALAAARAGHDVIACPEDTVYLDYRQSDDPAEPIPVGTVTTVADVYAFDPVPEGLTAEEAAHVLGGQGNLWTEHIDSPRMLDYYAFPRLSALAEALWSDGERDYAEFEARLQAHLARLDAFGVEYRRTDGPLPWQQRPGVVGRPSTKEAAAAHLAAITANIG